MANNESKRPPLVAPRRTYAEKKPPKQKKPKKFLGFLRRKAKPGPIRGPRKGRIRGWLYRATFGVLWWVTIRIVLILVLIVGSSTAYYYSTLPEAFKLMDDRTRGSVTMLDDNNQVFAWRGDQFGGLVTSDSVSKHLKNAVIATEDKRFNRHFGLSPRGIIGAIRTNIREGRKPWEGHGGSTITQQVSKRVFFPEMRSLERKIKEVPMSLALELKYTKAEILSIYLNRAYLGAGSYGFEAASQRYFGRSADTVSPQEAAMLAGLLKAPSKFAPTRNLARAQGRGNLILGLMEDQGYLTASEARLARANPARLSTTANSKAGGFFADWIMESGPEFLLKDTTEDVIIKTTFDRRIQDAAETALAHIFDTKIKPGSNAQAAIVVMTPDGAVKAMVGGRKTGIAGDFNRATQALRQTGSSFKPFVYAAALEQGYTYDTLVLDEPITIDVPGSGPWTPRNYSGTFLGPVTLNEALSKSLNTSAVRVAEAVGRKKVSALAADFGIKNTIAPGPAMALGASESTLLEMTGAYAGILNDGRATLPFGVRELTIQGDSTPLMGADTGTGQRVINEKAAGQLVYMMHQVVEIGSGKRAKLPDRQVAGKTGTTQGARDAWFIGFSADYVAGVWMGYDDNSKLTGVTGGGLPADIWRETMLRVHEGIPPKALPMLRPAPKLPDPEDNNRGRGNLADAINQAVNEGLRKLDDDLGELDREVGNVLDKVLEGLFGKKKN